MPDGLERAREDVRPQAPAAAEQARVLMTSFGDALADEMRADMRRLADLVAGSFAPAEDDRRPAKGR